ncbi:MAG: TrbI/VirB10 family protein [Alphaproteobacteria bacterium]
MAPNRESLSAQSQKRTNYLLLAFGVVLALLFMLAWCRMQPKPEAQVYQQSPVDLTVTSFEGEEEEPADFPNLSSRGDAQLVVTPSEVVMSPNVVIGSEAEAPIILRAENAPILLISKGLAEPQEDGFLLSGSCMSLERLAKDEECTLKVSWSPKTLRNIQNTLVIQWREHSTSVFRTERTNVLLKAQSTDSKDCVICEDIRKEAEKIPQKVITADGTETEITPDGKVIIDGKEYTPTDNGVVVDEKGGEVIAVVEPKRIPLGLKNEVLGTVADNRDVIDKNGKKIGRLLGDDTIIDPTQSQVIGKAIPMVPAMNEHGHVFGKMVLNAETLSVVDAKGKIVGFPHVDGQIVDAQNNSVGFVSPWGGVIDFTGKFLGVILPNGSVADGSGSEVATIRPMGFAVSKKGELVGGVVPRGVGVGAGGRSLGQVSLTGEVKDSFGQTIGHVLLDKAIVDTAMNELGSVVRQGIVIGETGTPIGFVNSEGKALNFKAVQIGVMTPDGTAFAHKKFVGTLMPEGRITKGGCSAVGSVYPNGSVVDLTLKTLGHITPSGKAVDAKKTELGVVVPWGTAIAEGCRLLGLISLNGDIVSTDGVKTGCMNTDKTVQNLQGQTVGEVTPLGLFINEQNQVMGRVRFDGQIMDNKGAVVGCVYEKSLQVLGYTTKGVIVDENGFPLGGTSIGNKAYDENGNWIGDVYFNGWVIGDKGQLKGVVPFSGVIFSDSAKVIGSYNQLTGAVTDKTGANLGRVLPGGSVINLTGTEILGKLIPEKTPFMRLDGSFLGILRSDGVLVGPDVPANLVIHSDGRATDKEGHLIGAPIPMGPVLASDGRYMGMVNQRGEVVDNRQIKIGRVLANGLAISDKNQVMGQVFPMVSVGVSTRGFVGSVEPKMAGVNTDLSYQLQVNDAKGNLAGNVSGTGVILGLDNAVGGHLIPVSPFVNFQGKLLGWTNFQGEVNNPDGRSMAGILPSGVALDASQNLIGRVIQEAVAVDTTGAYLGRVSARGEVLSDKAERIASLGETRFLYNDDGAIIGQILKVGVAVDLNGQFMGWTRYDGQIENGTKVLGSVGLDGHIFNANGQMIGRYLALGTEVFNDVEKSVGFLSDTGHFTEAGGLNVAHMGYAPYVATKGVIIGSQMPESRFVTSLESGRILGLASENASVLAPGADRRVGSVLMNRFFMTASHQVEGALVPTGLATMPTLGVIGSVGQDGQVYKAGKKMAVTTGNGLVYSLGGELIGGVFSPGVLIDKKGSFAGMTTGTPSILKNNKPIGNKLAFSSALSTSNEWLGNLMPSGGTVTDSGKNLGIIAIDGAVIGAEEAFVGRVLPDGSVAGVPERAVLNTMPYVGHTIQQGLPLGYKNEVLGHTTAGGDIEDNAAKKLFRILDDGTILGKDKPLAGVILPFISAVDTQGSVLGTLSSDGSIVSFRGQKVGTVAHNGAVKLAEMTLETDKLKNLGILVPEPLVVNDCKMVGQTAYDGRIVNGQGSVVGRIRKDKWAIDANGAEIGRVVRNGPVMSSTGDYLGRTLPDSVVVDLNGVEFACALNSGEVKSFTGEVVGHVVERGPVFDDNGNMIGRVDSQGRIINPTGGVIGRILGDGFGTAVDLEGNKIGRMFGRDEELFLGDDGRLTGSLGLDGWVRDKTGEKLYQVLDDDTLMTQDGQRWKLGDGLQAYLPGIGRLMGCELIGMDGQKVATLMADGTLRDDNGDLVYTVAPDGQVFAPNGTYVETFRGIDITTHLKQCGMSGASSASSGRKITLGNRVLTVDSNGSLVDEDGMIIGYLGEDGRPYTLGNKPITGSDISGRERPDTTPKFKPTPGQVEDFQEKLAQKRKGMKAQMGKGILTITAEMKARAKPKKDKDWEVFGYGRSRENTSTWPVDMTHVILQGKAIPAVLARSIDSRYTNVPAVAIVETNIYGEEGRNILIPAGSRLIGQMAGTGDQQNGVSKLQITWNRLIRPDGSAFNLAGAQSGDAQGRGAVAAYLDEQLWNKYGSSVLGVLAQSSVAYMLATNDDASTSTADGGTSTQTNKSQAANDARKAFIDEIGTILDDMIAKAQETPPVVFVPAGTRLTVFPQKDLWLRSVEDDEKEANEEFGAPSTDAQVPDIGSWTQQRQNEQDEQDSSSTTSTPEDLKKETETPLYDGRDHMPDISDRKIEPVAPQEAPLF